MLFLNLLYSKNLVLIKVFTKMTFYCLGIYLFTYLQCDYQIIYFYSKTFSFLIELISKEKTLYAEIKAISKSNKKTKENSKTNASREISKGEKKEKLKLKKKKASE